MTKAGLRRFADAMGALQGASGVYAVLSPAGDPLYVGLTMDVGWRLYCHAGNGGGLYGHILDARGIKRTAEAIYTIRREILGTYLVGFIEISAADGVKAFRARADSAEGVLQAILRPKYGRRELLIYKNNEPLTVSGRL